MKFALNQGSYKNYTLKSMTIKKLILLLSLTVCIHLPAKAQSHRFFTTDHELSSSLINQLYQDSYGMMWISTEDGLNRYDGAKFIKYRNIPEDSTSLQHNFVNLVFEDRNKRLFIDTYNGIQLYDRGADRFYPKLQVVTRNGEVKIRPITRMLERKNGDIIALCDDIYLLDEITDGKFILKEFEHDGDLNAIPYRVIEDKDDNLWLLIDKNGKNSKGLCRIDKKGHLTMFDHPAKLFLETIVTDNNGIVYTGSMRTGLYRHEPTTDTFTHIVPADGTELSIKNLLTDPVSGQIFIATDGQGLKIYNPRTEEIKDFVQINRDFNLPGDKVHHILKDNSGNFWLGIFQKGVVMFPEHQSTFGYIGSRSVIHNVIGDKCVTALRKDQNGILWVGTDNGGIYALNPDFSLRHHYQKGIPAVIMGMMDNDDHLLIGSYLEGWGLLDKATGEFRHIKTDETLAALSVYGFSRDNDRKIWLATMGNGVFTYDPVTYKTAKNTVISSSINNWVGSILYSQHTNRLYLGTYDGLFAADNCSSEAPHVFHIVPGTIVYCIYEEPNGKIWCGTSTGLLSYDPETGRTQYYTTADGMPSNTVYAIQGEGLNALWLSTSSGLSRFEPSNVKFSNFHAEDGLQSNEFYKNVSYKDSRGIMYFGGMNGITYFSPNDIKDRGIKYTARIADFYLHGFPVTTGMRSGLRQIIDKPVYETDRINLSYNDNSFSVEFSTYELNRPESVVFMYALDDDNWETLPYNVNRVNFSNINPGTHTLRVKAVDNDVYSDELTVKIDISPIWYNSWWARLIYLLIAAVAAWYIWHQSKNRQELKREKMERENADKMKEARLQFFTNISHEIRTPMTLVISPIEKLINSDNDPARQKEYRLIHRNAKRILRLVNELMDIRKIDKSQMHLTFTETNLVPLIDDICATFSQVTADHNITLSFNHENKDEMTAWVDTANFDKIIMNLLSNAVKFTPDGGKIDIDLSAGVNPDDSSPLGEYIEISVTDTGIGIPEEDRKHIFDRFYQVDTSNVKGTGIGLHLVNSLVQLHHGTIEVSDNPDGAGTRFVIHIPQGNSHLKVSDIALEPVATPESARIAGETPVTYNDTEEENNSKSLSPERILIVEDDEEIRHYISKELSPRYKVEECSNGKEALDIIFKKTPSLIISDVMMPEMDGFTLTRRIKKNINLQHIPVILLTAKTQDKDNIEGLESGADAYITKPFNIDLLVTTVNNLLLTRKRLRNIYRGNQSHDAKVNIQASSNDEKLMERIMKVLDKNISNPDITVEMLAEEVGMSRVHLHRRLKEITNQSPRDFIRNTRLRQAAKLMKEKRLSVSEAAMLTGFKNANNFATSFKEFFGMTPTEYINSTADRGGQES